MNRTQASLALSLAAASLAVASTQLSCTQPPVSCTASAAVAYAAKYKRTAGDDTCSVGKLSGDTLGLAAFNPAKTTADGQTVPDFNIVTLAIRSHVMGEPVARANDEGVVDTIEGNLPHAVGPFDSPLPEGDICTASLGPSRQILPELPADEGDPEDPEDDLPVQPEMNLEEEWTDVKLYVTAANLGTQMKAHYKITDNVAGCSAEYDVLAVYPAAFCDDGTGAPSDDLCNPEAQPEKGIPVGSGISPDYPVVCDPTLLLCVIDADPSAEAFPVLRAE